MSHFTSHQVYLSGNDIQDVPVASGSTVESILPKITVINDNTTLKPLLYQLLSILKTQPETHVDLMDHMFRLLNNADKEISGCAYVIIQQIADQLDADELVERMMDQLICISWDFDTPMGCINAARLSSMYMALFGQGLEKMKRAREWMLFLPFLANYIVKTIDGIETVLIEKSLYGGNKKKERDGWEDTVDLFTGSCLDLIEFIHTCTVVPPISEFPIETIDIGLENGDVKRRYLGYYLTCLIYDRILLNTHVQFSKTYFDKFHAMYNIQRPNQVVTLTDPSLLALVQRCLQVSSSSGFTLDRMMCLYESLGKKDHYAISLEDKISEDDRQMINSRMYPLSHGGIGALISFSVYDHTLSRQPVGIFPLHITDALSFAKNYIGIILLLLSGPNAMQVDKGVFVLLYLSDKINTTVTMQDLEKQVKSPQGGFQASQLIEIISSVASTHPDPSIRFFSYKLVEKFLNFGDDETRVFLLTELLETCPFHCMKTAAIGLLKDQINQAFAKGVSVFTSPLIVKKFFPLVFQAHWKEDTFWDDYSHVMQALNLYFYLLIKDKQHNLTTVWNQENIESMQKNYLTPLVRFLDALKPNKEIEFQDMQIDMMKNVVSKILAKVSN